MESENQRSTHPLRLAWLGAPLITYLGKPLTIRTRKAVALLVYLTTETGIHTREKLTTLFWPESDSAHGRSTLRTSLAHLREAMEAIDASFLYIEPQTLSFDFNSHFELDLYLLQAGLDALQRQPTLAEREEISRQLQRAVDCYRGGFLEGFSLNDAPAFDDWASLQREVWHNRMNLILDTLSQWQFEAGDLSSALETAERWQTHDLYGERAPQRLMQIHFANGNRADALQVYDEYARMLAAEFGGKPSAATKALAARIRARSSVRPRREQGPLPLEPVEPPFVGRADEFALLMTAYHAASQGRTQVIILTGETGIGKTRLATEFLHWVTAQGADVLTGCALETVREFPYQLVAHLLRHQLEQEKDLTELLSPTWLAELSRLLPEVRERYPDLPQSPSNEATAQSRLLESITRLGQTMAERAPLVLFLDDLQWADLPSLDALQYALSRWTEQKTPILLLLCSRELSSSANNTLHQWVASRKARLAVTQVTLGPLTVEYSQALAPLLESGQTEQLPQQAQALTEYIASHAPAELRTAPLNSLAVEESSQPSFRPLSAPALHDWGEMPTIGPFHGREQELVTLSGWLQEGPRIVALLGIGGVGKTALAAQTVRQVADRFDFVIWSSLLNAPPLSEILRHWLQTLSRQTITRLETSLNDQIRMLLELLRQQHCLLILDNVESILHSAAQADASAGSSRPGYEDYEQLLHSLSSGAHRSTLLLTSRELPVVLSLWQGQPTTVRALQLTGLSAQAGQALLQAQGLSPTEWTASALVQQYSGNPLALQIISRTILDLYNGDIEAFTQEGLPIFDNIRTVLDQQFARLSALERELLIWLAIEREAVTTTVLRTSLVDKRTQRAFLEALRSLQQRSLLEKVNDGFTLQNVVIEYVTEHLVETVCAELTDFDKVTEPGHLITQSPSHLASLSLLNHHALLKAQSKDYVRESQKRLILQPIGEWLLKRFGRGELKKLLYRYLDHLRSQLDPERQVPGYAAGNLLNLALHSALDLAAADFSKLAVWQADLRGAYVPGLNFAGADLTSSVFTQVFGSLYEVQFNPQNELLVGEVNAGHLLLRNLASDSVLYEYALDVSQIQALLLSAGPQLAALVGHNNLIYLFDLRAGEIRHTLMGHQNRIWRGRFDGEGKLLATGDAGGQVYVWHCTTGELLYTLSGATTSVTAVAFSPNGQLLAIATVDGTVFLWELISGTLIQTLRGHAEEVAALEFVLDGTLLATGSHDTTVGLWSVTDGRLLQRFVGHTQPIRHLAITGSSQLLASGGGDSFIYVWDIASGQALHILSSHASALERLSISPDGHTVATVDLNDVVSLWDIRRGLRVNAYPIYRNVIWALAFHSAGERMVTGGADSAIYLWDVQSGQPARLKSRLTGAHHRVMAIAFHADGNTVAGADGNEIQLWDVQVGRLQRTLHGHSGAISRVAFHPAGHQLASSGDRTICLWSIERGHQVRQLRGHSSTVTCCSFSPPLEDGLSAPIYLLASGSLDQTVLVWDVETGKLLHTLRGHTNAVTDCLFSPDGRYLFSASYDQTIRVWCVQTGQVIALWPTPNTVYFTLAMHPSGKVVAAAGEGPVIRLFAVDSGRLLGELHGHSDNISSVHFSPHGERLVSTSWDETIKLWAVTESAEEWLGSCVQTVESPGPYAGMNISGATGISPAQKAVLLALGAVEE